MRDDDEGGESREQIRRQGARPLTLEYATPAPKLSSVAIQFPAFSLPSRERNGPSAAWNQLKTGPRGEHSDRGTLTTEEKDRSDDTGAETNTGVDEEVGELGSACVDGDVKPRAGSTRSSGSRSASSSDRARIPVGMCRDEGEGSVQPDWESRTAGAQTRAGAPSK